MSSWRCVRCRTVYAVGIAACPQCGETSYSEGGVVVAKASAEGGATHFLAAGDPVPGDLPPGVRLVGPGAPAEEAGDEADAAAEQEAGAEDPGKQAAGDEPPAPPKVNDPKAAWVDHAVSQGLSPEEAAAKTKAQLIEDHGSP